MRLTTKLSAFITFLSLLAMSLMLAGCALSVFWFSHQRVEHRAQVLATEVDQAMFTESPAALHGWLTRMMPIMNAEQISLHDGKQTFLTLSRHENQMLEDEPNRFFQVDVPLMHQPAYSCGSLPLILLKPGYVLSPELTRWAFCLPLCW